MGFSIEKNQWTYPINVFFWMGTEWNILFLMGRSSIKWWLAEDTPLKSRMDICSGFHSHGGTPSSLYRFLIWKIHWNGWGLGVPPIYGNPHLKIGSWSRSSYSMWPWVFHGVHLVAGMTSKKDVWFASTTGETEYILPRSPSVSWISCVFFSHWRALHLWVVDQSDTEVAVKDNLMERGTVKGSQFQEPLIEFSTLAVRNRLGVWDWLIIQWLGRS